MTFKEYRCKSCGKVFEALIRSGETPVCPACGSGEVGTNYAGGVCNRPAKSHCSGKCSCCKGCH